MRPDIGIRFDQKRGCGWRTPGGLYLVSDGLATPCGRLPIPLDICPTCSHGIKPSRGFTWIDGDAIIEAHPCRPPEGAPCNVHCPLSTRPGRVGLLWIGEVYYATPGDFCREADRLGVSRRIPDLPRGFIVGRTWVWLAHRKTVARPCGWCGGERPRCSHCEGKGHTLHPGVFRAHYRIDVHIGAMKAVARRARDASAELNGTVPLKPIRYDDTEETAEGLTRTDGPAGEPSAWTRAGRRAGAGGRADDAQE